MILWWISFLHHMYWHSTQRCVVHARHETQPHQNIDLWLDHFSASAQCEFPHFMSSCLFAIKAAFHLECNVTLLLPFLRLNPVAERAAGHPLWKDRTVWSSNDWPNRPHDSPVVSRKESLMSIIYLAPNLLWKNSFQAVFLTTKMARKVRIGVFKYTTPVSKHCVWSE